MKSSVAMQEQMLGGKGFLVIGYLLEKVSVTASDGKSCGFKSCFFIVLLIRKEALVFTMTSAVFAKVFKAFCT